LRPIGTSGGKVVYSSIPAAVVFGEEALDVLYRKMVDENLVRKDTSFAEMACLAIKYANDKLAEFNDPDRIVALLLNWQVIKSAVISAALSG
jgi:ParB family chromosome partitioning protein